MISRDSHRRRFLPWLVLLCTLLTQATKQELYAQQLVVVCPAQFTEAIKPWLQRRVSEGYAVRLIPPRETAERTKTEVIAAFTALLNGQDGPKSLNKSVASDTQCSRFLFLIGDVPTLGKECDVNVQVPTFYQPAEVTVAWGSTPTIPTDTPYTDLNIDGKPDAAVGRLPADGPQQIRDWTARLFQREDQVEEVNWRSEVQLVGGVGGFGAFADRAIESVASTIVTGVLPTEVRTHVLYGSPGHRFYPLKGTFSDAVVDQFSRGARFWVYAGHGQVTELDRVPPDRDGIPVLDRKSIRRLACAPAKAPVALLLACYTGALDAAEDSISESMLFSPGGPVALISGSRITMPYGNASLAVELIHSFYVERCDTLGLAWLRTQCALLKEMPSDKQPFRVMIDGLAALISPSATNLAGERREHVLLYGLIGDPTQKMAHGETMEMVTMAGHDRLAPVTVSCVSPIAGMLNVRVDRPLGAEFSGDPNRTLLAESSVEVGEGESTEITFNLDPGVSGPLVLRAMVSGGGRFATGATKTIIRP